MLVLKGMILSKSEHFYDHSSKQHCICGGMCVPKLQYIAQKENNRNRQGEKRLLYHSIALAGYYAQTAAHTCVVL